MGSHTEAETDRKTGGSGEKTFAGFEIIPPKVLSAVTKQEKGTGPAKEVND